MNDYIVRATAGNGSILAFAATTKNLVNTAYELHQTTPVATAALGRLLTAMSMMGATLKNDSDIITATIKGDGVIGGLVATTDNQSNVKGFDYQPHIELLINDRGKLDVGKAIGAGTLTITKDLGLREPVSGQVDLISGEIAEDITYYFAASEQLPSSVALGVLVDTDNSVKQAGGFILQLMPGARDEIIAYLEEKLPQFPAVTALLEEGKSPEDILRMLFEGQGLTLHEKIYPTYSCNCSVEKTRKALLNVGAEELKTILEEDKGANLHCHFCNRDYYFGEEIIREMLSASLEVV